MSQQIVPVLVKIAASVGAGDAASTGAAFEQHSQTVQNQIKALGGKITGKIWLTNSIKANIAVDQVEALQRLEGVISVQTMIR